MQFETVWEGDGIFQGHSIVRKEGGECFLYFPSRHYVGIGKLLRIETLPDDLETLQPRNRRLSVRLTEQEFDQVREKADTHYLPVSDFVRLVLAAQPKK